MKAATGPGGRAGAVPRAACSVVLLLSGSALVAASDDVKDAASSKEAASSSVADAASSKDAASSSVADPVDPAPFSASGYLDVSHNNLSSDGRFISGAPTRVYDTRTDGFALQQLAGTILYQPKLGLGGLVNVLVGNDAEVVRAYGDAGDGTKVDLPQAFIQYATSEVTFMAGKFSALGGAEGIAPPTNTNFSRSYLVGAATPATTTGLRSSIAPTDALTFYVGVDNGWDDFKDTNSAKTVELGATYSPSKSTSIGVSGYFGTERVGGLVNYGEQGERSLYSFVSSWNIKEDLAWVMEVDYGTQANVSAFLNSASPTATWSGIAEYLNYGFDDRWKSSSRVEYFDDNDGYRTGVPQTLWEVTETVSYLPTKAIELRSEVRRDSSNARSFSNSSTPGDASKTQESVGVEALYKF